MAVGDGAQAAVRSYVALGKEATFGTYASATSAVEAISCGFKVDIESKKLESLGKRGYAKRVQLNKSVGGELEEYLHPHASVLLFAATLGGGITSALHTTGVYNHSLTAGNFDTAPASLSFNVRKGDTHTWRYSGGRVNQLKLSAQVGDLVKASYSMIFKDATQQSDDISGILSVSSVLPFVFNQGQFRYAATEANAATTTAAEPIQGFELTINNNMVDGNEARQLGTNILSVLPATRRDIELKVTQRFDTTTAYNRFIQATQGAVELFFQAEQIGSTGFYNECTLRFPKVFVNSPDPELKSDSEILQSEFTLDVVDDAPSTSTGKDIGVTFRNATAAY